MLDGRARFPQPGLELSPFLVRSGCNGEQSLGLAIPGLRFEVKIAAGEFQRFLDFAANQNNQLPIGPPPEFR